MVKKIIKTILVVVVLTFGFVIFALSRQVGGYRAFVVMSSSMEPTIRTGSLVITNRESPYNLKSGDVVTFVRPDGPREFITHRIVSVSNLDTGIPTFQTKGDNNSGPDNWILVGGGVVGRVIFWIPYLGYLLSLAKTKVGIALLIILPAIWIIIDEIISIFKVVKKKPDSSLPVSIFILGISVSVVFSGTKALLSDSATLTDVEFTTAVSPSPVPTPTPTSTSIPTPTPTPTPSCPAGSIIISGNGEGSTNTVDVVCVDTTIINQTNFTNVQTDITTNVDTGGNNVSADTGGTSTIISGSSSSSVTVTVTGGSNSQ